MPTSNDFPMPRRIVLFGSGGLGKEMMIELKCLGRQVVAVNSYPGAPAMQFAGDHRVTDVLDGSALRRLPEETKPDLAVLGVKAIATDELVDFEEYPSARTVPDAFVVQTTMDRQSIHALAASLGRVRTSKFRFISSLERVREALEHTGSLAFIKSTMSSSGHGQSRIVSAQKAEAVWTYALEGARSDTGCVIVEEEMDFGSEITLLTIRSWDRESADVATGFYAPIGHHQEHGDYVEFWQPARIGLFVLGAAQRVAKTVTDTLTEKSAALALGLFGVEFSIKGEDVWSFELSLRPHDTDMTAMVSQSQPEFELYVRMILKLPVNPSLRMSGASAVVKSSQRIAHLEYRGVAAALGVMDAVRIFGKPVARARHRLGIVLATGATTEETRRRASSGASLMSVAGSREVE